MVYYLIKASCPAHSLCPGLLELSRLLVVKNSLAGVSYLFALYYQVGGKLKILCKQMIRPASVFLKECVAKQITGSRNGCGRAQYASRAVKILRFSHKCHGVSGGDPVCAEVFGITVACNNAALALREFLIHLGEEILFHDVVCVENYISVV